VFQSRDALLSVGGQSTGEHLRTITMLIWKMIEILEKGLNILNRLGKGFGFESSVRVREWRRASEAFSRKIAGSHDIKQANWELSSGFDSFFLPCGVPLNLSSSLRHCI
jgi:hypothetical protein